MIDKDLVAQGRQYHIACAMGEVGRYVFLPGDPGRASLIAGFLDDARPIAQNREFVTYTGTIDGIPVSVCSTGIGSPSAAIALEELAAIGADTFVRIGRSGGLQPNLRVASMVIATGAVRDEGTSRAYLPIEFPAVADLRVVNALIDAAAALGVTACRRSVLRYGDGGALRDRACEESASRLRSAGLGQPVCRPSAGP